MALVDQAMSRHVVFVGSETDVVEALATARRHDLSHLPVRRGREVVGMLCTCALEDAPPGARASRFMHGRCAACGVRGACAPAREGDTEIGEGD
jgi:CBS domain-containing protein